MRAWTWVLIAAAAAAGWWWWRQRQVANANTTGAPEGIGFFGFLAALTNTKAPGVSDMAADSRAPAAASMQAPLPTVGHGISPMPAILNAPEPATKPKPPAPKKPVGPCPVGQDWQLFGKTGTPYWACMKVKN